MRVTASGAPVVSIAPMMDWTDRHYRFFARTLTRNTLLYTEMITTGAILHGDRSRLLDFDPVEHPLALQLGGDDPEELARCVEIASEWGYDEFNLNVGCPSDRVQEGHFGACLMASPQRVREIIAAMRSATDRPVTVKHRIGIDGRESYEEMREFVDIVGEAEPSRFTVHARIAILGGLSPKQNRQIPPLRYADVERLKRERSELEIELNGHIRTIDAINDHLETFDAVMVGRAAYEDPWLLARLDHDVLGVHEESAVEPITRERALRSLYPYLERMTRDGMPPRRLFNHVLGLFAGRPGGRRFRQALSGRLPDLPPTRILEEALARVPESVRTETPDRSFVPADDSGAGVVRREQVSPVE